MKRQICPEHKVRQKIYKVAIIVNKRDERIVDVYCDDCAASLDHLNFEYKFNCLIIIISIGFDI